MAFTAKDVKELRDKTGAGMMDCKKALTENDGNIEAAVDFLRQKGLAAAAKKATRIAAEGLVGAAVEGSIGVVVEVNCETDFVTKTDDFKGFVSAITNHLLSSKSTTVEALKAETMGSESIQERVQELTLKIGEKIDIRRFERTSLTSEGKVGSYVHGGKIGVLVELETESSDASKSTELTELVNDLCLHVAASDPKFMVASEIDEEFKLRESKIYEAQLIEQGKPEKMIPNIIKGKLNKLASEVCLMDQKFVKNPDLSITALVKEVEGKIGSKITVKGFNKINLGQGIEKKVDNLAEEVAKLTQA
jgi:elongation factor Ts